MECLSILITVIINTETTYLDCIVGVGRSFLVLSMISKRVSMVSPCFPHTTRQHLHWPLCPFSPFLWVLIQKMEGAGYEGSGYINFKRDREKKIKSRSLCDPITSITCCTCTTRLSLSLSLRDANPHAGSPSTCKVFLFFPFFSFVGWSLVAGSIFRRRRRRRRSSSRSCWCCCRLLPVVSSSSQLSVVD